jgi:hypothetical protein
MSPFRSRSALARTAFLVSPLYYRLSVEALDTAGNTSARSADYVFVGV